MRASLKSTKKAVTPPSIWLDRQLAPKGPYLAICTNEEEYLEACAQAKVPPQNPWLNKGAVGTTHSFIGEALVCLVCVDIKPKTNPVSVIGLLAHEATHVCQSYFDWMGEEHPGREQEAYAMQAVVEELITGYAARTGK
jgi:hypothetical protein